ncbi:MAG: aminotransferase class I/II-fold pyridoxal phosphate-dependent enzyme [Balneolaceae bacterium]|nr:aminotransferase class I/II-fold pyridoxal phosphate-dependent enzyme [Balneolaceae bacterium]
MDAKEFREQAHRMVDWMADYFEQAEELPVKPTVKPGDILKQLPASPPEESENYDAIFSDFRKIVMPGMTHWESPMFMGYFPANKSYPSVLAEMLTATLGAQCMSWVTSPAATELEERMMEWLRELCGLPPSFTGVIQDTASTATLCALLMAREQATGFGVNEDGPEAFPPLTVYGSSETHSSIEKGVKIAGYGRSNLRKVPVDETWAMDPQALEKAIRSDLEAGYKPACVVATLGTTGSTAIDPLGAIADICSRYDIFLHVDAAYAGTALLLPEKRAMAEGMERADAYVFNPHKWMFTNFDCSAFYVRDEELLVRTFEILPEYLKSSEGDRVTNYRDWGIQLGRRFRALKLWFVIRSFGAEGLRDILRGHLRMAGWLEKQVQASEDFEMLAPVPLNALCLRFHPPHIDDEEKLDELNRNLLEAVQRSGELFITHTTLDNRLALRVVCGNTRLEQRHVEIAWRVLRQTAQSQIGGNTP